MTVALCNDFNGMKEITKTFIGRLLTSLIKEVTEMSPREFFGRLYDWSIFIASDLRLTLAMMTGVKTLLIGILE